MTINLDHLKLCVEHDTGYQCARCARGYCMSCDRALGSDDERVIKTIVRYCPDWRCKREEKLEGSPVLLSYVPLPQDAHPYLHLIARQIDLDAEDVARIVERRRRLLNKLAEERAKWEGERSGKASDH